MVEYEDGVNLENDNGASTDLDGSDERKDGDIDGEHVFSRVRSWLYDDSAEDKLSVLPRVDGKKSSPWRSQDIGFFLPSHYFEREDGQTPRSMAVPQSEWDSAVDGMNVAVQRLAEANQYFNLVGGPEVPSQRRMAAAAVFLADILEDIDNAPEAPSEH